MKHHSIHRFFKTSEKPNPVPIPSIDIKEEPKRTQRTQSQVSFDKNEPQKKKLTPLDKQIIELKANNPDKLLAIQVGYKYKFFGQDAEIVSPVLNIMLVGTEDPRFKYCSIPDNRLHVHLKKLLPLGYMIGVVKQTELAVSKSIDNSRGLFERKVTGIYTNATYMNEELESDKDLDDDNSNNYIVAFKGSSDPESPLAVVVTQPITGEIIVDDLRDNILREELETRLTYFNPSEIILINGDSQVKKLINSINNSCRIMEVEQEDEEKLDDLQYFLESHEEGRFKELIDYYKLNYSPPALSCFNELIKYLMTYNLSTIFTITENITKFRNDNFMILLSKVIRSLEIYQNSTDGNNKGSLFWLLNHTRTKMGERLLKKWVASPLKNENLISERVLAIEDLSKGFNHFIDCFKKVLDKLDIDLSKKLIKVSYSVAGNIKSTRTDVHKMLITFNEILKLIKNFSNDINKVNQTFKSDLLKSIFNELLSLSHNFNVEEEFLKKISLTYDTQDQTSQKINYFNLNYHDWPEISEKHRDIELVKQDIEEEVKQIRVLLKKPNLRLVKNLNQDYLIEIRNTLINTIPVDWIRINATKVVTRFRSPRLQELNKMMLYHHEQLVRNCDLAFKKFLESIVSNFTKFSRINSCIATFDCLFSLTVTRSNGCKPEISKEKHITIKDFKNPIIETLTSNYVTNDIKLTEDENRISIITGPNMGGKSSLIKSVGLLVLMNQIGCFLPCKSAKLSIFDSIFIRLGSDDNIISGKSTFMVEMLEVLHIINNFNDKSLILLDEVGKGTGTKDGLSIAYSVLNWFCQHETKHPIVLFITHYPFIAKLKNQYSFVNNFFMDYLQDKENIIFLYKLVEGVVNNLYGLNVAKISGIPMEIINTATETSNQLKNEIEVQSIMNIIKLIKEGELYKIFNEIID